MEICGNDTDKSVSIIRSPHHLMKCFTYITNTLGNLNCLFCCQLHLIITVFIVGEVNVSLCTKAEHHNPDSSDGKRRHSGSPKCSLPPIAEPLHFLINSKQREKGFGCHSEQINQVNNYRLKVGQLGKKHSGTAGSNGWFIMLPECSYTRLCRQYGGYG